MYILIPTIAPIPQTTAAIISNIESSGPSVIFHFILKNCIISRLLLHFL
ncbi:uncharacterized protein METZ01_LOCUS162831 [marine metagenome]|uniref:Uncharacterized protein n=1 Tax=marine metagenome TaxID=408172 RepID=A0A382B9S1_9ZZZZ